MSNFLGLSGDFKQCEHLPERCPHCSCKEFYKQSDFKRSLGITLVSISSLLTCVLFAMGYNWWLVWSPMFLTLIIDRSFHAIRPVVAICYDCSLIYRGLNPSDLDKIAGFSLDTYDRIQYPKREGA
ncbi:MAG: hypothetical protein KA116_03520 [Proteobacteria bacterium]|nr:hypothetical protein [Pseudomonadota bacterium]